MRDAVIRGVTWAGLVALWDRLWGSARVTMVSAPPGSGKTVLLRSWINQAGLTERAGLVTADPEEHDPPRFRLSVLRALRGTVAGLALVQSASAAPGLDGRVLVVRAQGDSSGFPRHRPEARPCCLLGLRMVLEPPARARLS